MDNNNSSSQKTKREILLENVLNNMVIIERFNTLLSDQEQGEDYYLNFKETSRKNLQSTSEEKLGEILNETMEEIEKFNKALGEELSARQGTAPDYVLQREHSPIPPVPLNEFRPPELRDEDGERPSSPEALSVIGSPVRLKDGPHGKNLKGSLGAG